MIFHHEEEAGSVPPTGKLNTLEEEHEMFPDGDDGWPRGSVEGDGDATELTRLKPDDSRHPASAPGPHNGRAPRTPRR